MGTELCSSVRTANKREDLSSLSESVISVRCALRSSPLSDAFFPITDRDKLTPARQLTRGSVPRHSSPAFAPWPYTTSSTLIKR